MDKPRAIIFGAGVKGKSLLPTVQTQYEVTAFIDNDKTKWGEVVRCDSGVNIPICDPITLKSAEFEMVIIGTYVGLGPMTEQLLGLGVSRSQIDSSFVYASVQSRIMFLERVGQIFEENGISGCVAEGGVFQGEYAKEINRVFPQSTFYLFDTFTGFDARDVSVEASEGYSQSKAGHFNLSNEELVLSKLPHPDKCVFRKGYFPETTLGLDESFCFVNLDFDLYKPILAGLEYFVPRMVPGGIILVDDYFAEGYKGVKAAVKKFQTKSKPLNLFPVGDGNSIGILL